MTKTDEILSLFRDLNVWKRGEERAPHKPLLVLFALARLQTGSDRLICFNDLEIPLARLLEEFGPPRKSFHPELPFYHLQSDGVWEIHEPSSIGRKRGGKIPLLSELRQFQVRGGFPAKLHNDLAARPEAVREVAKELLAAHFPESLHDAIRGSVGPDLEGTGRSNRRDTQFRSDIVAAWNYQCAFCGFSARLDHALIALDAAHIQWCQFGGPDTLNNGVACCSIHHQAFDRGAISISEDQRILISSRLNGQNGTETMFSELSRKPLRSPNQKKAFPKSDFLAWHRRQVFRGEARD